MTKFRRDIRGVGGEVKVAKNRLAKLALEKDPRGYLVVDGNMETSCPGVFAVGDVANPTHPCIATAIGSGTMAARRIQQLLAPRNEPASGRGSG